MRSLIGFRALAIGLLGVVSTFAAVDRTALATPPEGVTGGEITRGTLADGAVDVQVTQPVDTGVQELTIAPGGTTGWHSHPGPAIAVIKSGTLTLYDAHDPSCTGKSYSDGEGFVDPGRGHVHIARNESATTPVVVLAVYLDVPVAGSPRIDQPAPGNCAF